MKKVILTISAFVLFVSYASAKHIHIHREGSNDGVHYNRVVEHSTWFSHTLTCKDPGATTCAWATTPVVGGFSADEIESFVMDKIRNGSTTGETNYNGTVLVKWTYDVNGVLDIEMTDEF